MSISNSYIMYYQPRMIALWPKQEPIYNFYEISSIVNTKPNTQIHIV